MKGKGLVNKVLAALLTTIPISNKALAEGRFSVSASGGTYFPSAESIGLGGLPYGGEIEIDYGNGVIGFKGGGGWYTKTGYQRGEFDWGGGLGDGERERATFIPIRGGARIGSKVNYVGFGGVIAENNDYFEMSDRKFLRQEFTQIPDREVLYGPYIDFGIGKRLNLKIDEEESEKKVGLNLFFKAGLDWLFNRYDKDPVYGVRFNAGVGLDF